MATHDYDIANQSGAAFRTDLNNALAAIQSNNSNSSSPATTVAYQWWADTNAAILKIRNSSNNAWINLFTLAGGLDVDAASNFNEDVTFTGASANIVFDKSDSSLEWNDNAKATFGASEDLQIYHNGSNSIIDSNTGNLEITADSFFVNNAANNEVQIKAVANGAVELYYDNVKSLETISEGCTIQKDGSNVNAILFIKATNGGQAKLQLEAGGNAGGGVSRAARIDFVNTEVSTASLWTIINDYNQNGTNDLSIRHGAEESITANMDSAVELFFDNSKKLETTNGGVTVTGSFIATSNVEAQNNMHVADGKFFLAGNANDLQLHHDGTNSYIQHGTVGNLRYQSNNHDFYNQAGSEFMCRMFADGGVNLYFDHSQKFQVDTNGINVTGGISGASTISTANSGDAAATFNRTTSTGIIVELRFDGNNKGTISTDGSNVAFNTSASDRTLKKNFESWNENVLDLFKNINPQKFNFIDQQDTDAKMKGFIAQDLINSFPEGYTKNKENKYMFNPSGMVVYLMKAIQELESKVAALEAA